MGLKDVLFKQTREVTRTTVGTYNRPPFERARKVVYNSQIQVRKVRTVYTRRWFWWIKMEVVFEHLDYFCVHRLKRGGHRSFVISTDETNISSTVINQFYQDSLAEVMGQKAHKEGGH